MRPVLDIYSASGMPLASLLVSISAGLGTGHWARPLWTEHGLRHLSLQWKSGPVVALGWSAEEELLCVQEDGAVLVYGLHGDFRRHFSMGNVRTPSTWEGR